MRNKFQSFDTKKILNNIIFQCFLAGVSGLGVAVPPVVAKPTAVLNES